MTDADRDQIVRQRFWSLTAVRLGGFVMLGFGLAVAMTGLIRPGGWPALGGGLASLGAIESAVLPRLLKAAWDRADR